MSSEREKAYHREYQKKWRKKNLEKVKEREKRYRENNPGLTLKQFNTLKG